MYKKIRKYSFLIISSLVVSYTLSFLINKILDVNISDTFSGITTLVAIVVTLYMYDEQRQLQREKDREEKDKDREEEEKIKLKDREEEKKRIATKQRDAAKLVVMQIDHADSVIQSAKKSKKISATLPKFLGESEWDKNRHILVERLNITDRDLINRYFVACEQLEETRKIVVNLQAEQLNEKARCIQQQLSSQIVEIQSQCDEYTLFTEIEEIQKNKVLPFFNRLDFLYIKQPLGDYDPQFSTNFLTQVLYENDIEIKGTTSYQSLREIAGMD
ncbi:hypothetical protein C0W54_21075 [Photobacterium kishitanii]|uniref:hypothetical protein n=1 Tax=Photobacterium kishitanii TaxID=318456 RepID=UPI000D16E767|nr:hypothetical protein [Photobacterium kishitanii]PSW58760.1 hypothetical protein C0W54_21075 [Photobacterium kishitanii]